MRLPRMTTRRWMIAVAVVAAVGASARMATLRARYVRIARWRAVGAVEARGLAEFWDGQAALRMRSAEEIASAPRPRPGVRGPRGTIG